MLMNNISIDAWVGRLGNNIVQLKHAIQVALFYNYNIILPERNSWGQYYFNKTYICINNNISIEDNIIRDENNFFYSSQIKKYR